MIAFSDIPEEGLALHFSDKSWLPPEVTCTGPVSADVFLEKKDSRVILNGRLHLPLELSCDRCLEGYKFNLENSFVVDFELTETAEIEDEELEYPYQESEMDTVLLSKPEIDVIQTLEQQVLLALPMKSLCRENCRGLCVTCGANLNEGHDACKCEKEVNSPFSVLAELKK